MLSYIKYMPKFYHIRLVFPRVIQYPNAGRNQKSSHNILGQKSLTQKQTRHHNSKDRNQGIINSNLSHRVILYQLIVNIKCYRGDAD